MSPEENLQRLSEVGLHSMCCCYQSGSQRSGSSGLYYPRIGSSDFDSRLKHVYVFYERDLTGVPDLQQVIRDVFQRRGDCVQNDDTVSRLGIPRYQLHFGVIPEDLVLSSSNLEVNNQLEQCSRLPETHKKVICVQQNALSLVPQQSCHRSLAYVVLEGSCEEREAAMKDRVASFVDLDW